MKVHVKTHDGYTVKYRNEKGDFYWDGCCLWVSRIHLCNFCDHLSNKIFNVKKNTWEESIKTLSLSLETMALPQQLRKWWRGKNLTDRVHSCDECDFQSAFVYVLQKHISITHDGGQAIKCGECDYESDLKRILQYIWEISIFQEFSCVINAIIQHQRKNI